jgi:hypothetical protein
MATKNFVRGSEACTKVRQGWATANEARANARSGQPNSGGTKQSEQASVRLRKTNLAGPKAEAACQLGGKTG